MYWKNNIVVLCVAITILSSTQLSRAGDDPAARETVERISHLLVAKSSIATLTMRISNDKGKHDLSMKMWSAGGEDVLLRIVTPPAEANTAVLKIGNDVWYYLPKTNRTVKVPSAMTMNTWMGGDFTIDDLVKEPFLTRDYTIDTSFEGKRGGIAVYEYTLTPKPEAAVVWGKIVLQFRQADGVPTWQGYYGEDGKLARELTFSEYKTKSGKVIPTHLVMQSADKAGAHTTIDYEDIAFNVPIDAGTFSLPNMNR